MNKRIKHYAHEYSQWEALFLRVYVENAYHSYGNNKEAHTDYLTNKFSQYVFKNIQSCYIVLHYANASVEAHTVNVTMIMPSIQRILYTLCPRLKEITVEIVGVDLTSTQHLGISTEIARCTMSYRHSFPITLRICMTFGVFCTMMHVASALRWWNNTVSMQRSCTTNMLPIVCCALECTVRNISQLKTHLRKLCEMPTDIQQLAVHLSIQYPANVHPTHIDEIHSLLQAYNMYPYQYWHYVQDDNAQYISHYLETVFLLNSYLGLKLYKGRGKTISWMQGNSTHMSAIGTDTTKERWNTISPDEEMTLRIAQGAFGTVHLPRYIYDRLGKTQVQNAVHAAGIKQIRRHFFVKT